ncbi:GyrI-like domain-containing protein [Arcobacter sp. CECT 8985]|uniref:AraC family transcriptional regulator n=1 Tax=Arcobacter sp. CECT 8985 TaxID=1935424 RepID=UPI00100B6A1B|nr:AraC family transcriptional regulator [Arcobacter sp. CECT 8985]RXJ87777.1 AraC family transcriptional regulator [Arcobacter sp. CECT 8985]
MGNSTKDDYVQSICRVILYIEQNYNSELTLDILSKHASFSKYHFHRIFKSIVGESMGEYIRRVRLQSTTLQFKTNQKITQIAMNSGYETNASFSKAFKKHFGITPKEFAKNAKLKRGNKMLEPKIIKLEDIEILYVRKTGEYTKCSIEAWENLINFVGTEYFIRDDVMMFGIGHDNPNITQIDKLRYDACLSWVDKSIQEKGEIQSKIIDGGKYAVFLHKGDYKELINTYDGVSNWIIQSGVELRDLPIIEKYLNKNPITCDKQDLRTEIYIPII